MIVSTIEIGSEFLLNSYSNDYLYLDCLKSQLLAMIILTQLYKKLILVFCIYLLLFVYNTYVPYGYIRNL